MLSIPVLTSTWPISKTPTRQPGMEPCRARLTFETQSTEPSHTPVQMDESTGSEKSLRHSSSDLEAYTSPKSILTSGPIRLRPLRLPQRKEASQSRDWTLHLHPQGRELSGSPTLERHLRLYGESSEASPRQHQMQRPHRDYSC